MAKTVTARAHPNIAFIKYWGNIDNELRLPANPSISMNLDGLYAETTVTWHPDLQQDTLILNDEPQQGAALQRVSLHLDALRQRLGIEGYAAVSSKN
ncbi:MAG: diphosphomevalonate decarboxylase, partial [Phototrophicales bacterium]